MMWYMVRCMTNNAYSGPFDEERAKKEAMLIVEVTKDSAEILPIGSASFVVKWSGVTIQDVRR